MKLKFKSLIYKYFTNENEDMLWEHDTYIVLGDPLALNDKKGSGLSFQNERNLFFVDLGMLHNGSLTRISWVKLNNFHGIVSEDIFFFFS